MNENRTPATSALTIMGILLVIFGVLAIGTPAVAGTAVVIVIGVLMLVAGIVQIVSGLRSEGFSDKLPPLVLGLITTLAGLGVLGHPLLGLEFLTLLLTAFFIIEGIWKIIASFGYRPATGWLAMLFSGVITLALGGLIWKQWPMSGLWAVGVLVGVDLLMTGFSLIAIAATIRGLRDAVQGAVQDAGPNSDASA
ncbi:HdeD family acid-resistance protein [Rubripirellula sp.]|jgi:uncharacterized membrane protein HdeD (DUF308 family)|nr:HdeD family acid-resistance protein [Planctomycetaceae bacterium]MDA9858866.1 HdeD family acid-resistance protein [Rubripirellula sp.]MDF1840492.1 HdeD family acid-resistance protein [Rubripirellula sp.]